MSLRPCYQINFRRIGGCKGAYGDVLLVPKCYQSLRIKFIGDCLRRR